MLDVTRVEKQIAGRCTEVSEETTRMLADMNRLNDSIGEHASSIRTRADMASTSLRTMMDSLQSSAGDFEPVFIKAMERASDAETRFKTLHDGFKSTTANSLERLQQVGGAFDESLANLKSGSGVATILLNNAGGQLQERTSDLERAATMAGDKLHRIEQALASRLSDIHLYTDQALIKIDNIQKAVNEQFHELSESVGHAVEQLNTVGGKLSHLGRTGR